MQYSGILTCVIKILFVIVNIEIKNFYYGKIERWFVPTDM